MTVCKTYQASQVTTSSRVALHVPIASLWFCTLPQVLTRAFQSKYQVFETVFAKTNDVVSVIGTSGRSLSELTSFPITVSRFTMHWSIVSSAGETMYVRGRRFDVWASSLLIHLQMTTSFFSTCKIRGKIKESYSRSVLVLTRFFNDLSPSRRTRSSHVSVTARISCRQVLTLRW